MSRPKGAKLSEESKLKMSKSKTGVPRSADARQKISIGLKTKYRKTPEHIRNAAEARWGSK
jgi:hypothetical protein